jgi:hypothetical protein
MLMLGTVISQLRQKVGIKMAQWYVMTLQLVMLLKIIIAHGIDLTIRTAQYTINLLVKIKQKLEPLLANFLTTVVELTKAGFILVKQTLCLIGQQLLIIVSKIRQRVFKQQNTEL